MANGRNAGERILAAAPPAGPAAPASRHRGNAEHLLSENARDCGQCVWLPCARARAPITAPLKRALTPNHALTPDCFDDHQWWGLAWARAFTATGDARFLNRSAAIFDFVAEKGWDEAACGGGVTWCPPPTAAYKNAITAELFISLAMALHPHAAAVGKAPSFYADWAAKAWAWLARPGGMVNSEGLINDGLDGATCANNNQTTWTYNQGALLSGYASAAGRR